MTRRSSSVERTADQGAERMRRKASMRRTIPEAIFEQVARRSDHIALRTGERSLTYAELGHVIAAAAQCSASTPNSQ